MGSGRNFTWQSLSQGKHYTLLHAIIFSRDTQAQCWPDVAEGIWQSIGAAQTEEMEGKHFMACLCRLSVNTSPGNPSTTAGCKTYMGSNIGQYVLTGLSFPAPSSEYYCWSFRKCTRSWWGWRFFCIWSKSRSWHPWRLHCLLPRPDLSPGSPPWDVHERSCNSIKEHASRW